MFNEDVVNRAEFKVSFADGFSIQLQLKQLSEISEEELRNFVEKLRTMTEEDATFLMKFICSYLDLGKNKLTFANSCKSQLFKEAKYEELDSFIRENSIFHSSRYRFFSEKNIRGKTRDSIFYYTCKCNIQYMNDLINILRLKTDELGTTSEYPFLNDEPVIHINGDEIIEKTIDLSFIHRTTQGRIFLALNEDGILTMRNLILCLNEKKIEGLGEKTRSIIEYVVSKYELNEE